MTLTTILLITILLMMVLLAWAIRLIQTQNKVLSESNEILLKKNEALSQSDSALLQSERDIDRIRSEMTSRELGFQQQLEKDIKEARKKSNNTQRSVLKGQIGEQFTPFITDFPYNPSDCRFMGEPIDYIIFQNLHECADGNVPIEDVQLIIAEVKTGGARLNQRQRIIKQVIENGQVSFKELRIKYCEKTDDIHVQ